MHSRELFRLTLTAGFLCAFIVATDASYAGDRPLNTTFHDEFSGTCLYTLGNSTYGGTIDNGETYSAAFPVTLPRNATIRFQRLYIYWTWSKNNERAIYPSMRVTVADPVIRDASLVARYSDSKGFASKNDFFCGMDSYDLAVPPGSQQNITITVENTATDGSTVVIQGAGVLFLYETPKDTTAVFWVQEGCDLLYSSYGITPEMATNRIEFGGLVDTSRVTTADLLIVAPSGGFSRADIPGMNRLTINRVGGGRLPEIFDAILGVLFPQNQGKEWTDVFTADEQQQIGTEEKEIRPYLRNVDNTVEIEDNGDYLELTNAVLSVYYG